MSKRLDLKGQKFGKLTVIEFSHISKSGKSQWKCICECGAETIASCDNLKTGTTKSCGCLAKEATSMVMTKHGYYARNQTLPEYEVWQAMKARCTNPNNPMWMDYGGRGITVCDRWLDSFENFLSDMGKKPFKGAEIDRSDVNGNYEPSNCRWVTHYQNSLNKRKYSQNTSGYKGVSRDKRCGKCYAQIKVNGKGIYLGQFSNPLDAAKAYDAAAIKYFGQYACTNAMLGLL